MSGFYPEFEDSREVQLGSLAAIGFLLQIRDLLGDIDRFERSVRFKFSRSVWFKFFLETEKVQIQMFLGEKKPNLIWQLLLIKSGLLRVPNFRCGTGLSASVDRYITGILPDTVRCGRQIWHVEPMCNMGNNVPNTHQNDELVAVVPKSLRNSERLRTHNESKQKSAKECETTWIFRTFAPHLSLVHGSYFYYRKKFWNCLGA